MDLKILLLDFTDNETTKILHKNIQRFFESEKKDLNFLDMDVLFDSFIFGKVFFMLVHLCVHSTRRKAQSVWNGQSEQSKESCLLGS